MAYTLIFLLKNVKSYSHFFSKNTCELDIILTRTVYILITNELIKLTMLWTTGPSTFWLKKSALSGAIVHSGSKVLNQSEGIRKLFWAIAIILWCEVFWWCNLYLIVSDTNPSDHRTTTTTNDSYSTTTGPTSAASSTGEILAATSKQYYTGGQNQFTLEAYNSTNRVISSSYRVQNMFCAGCLSSDWLWTERLSRIQSCSLRGTLMGIAITSAVLH